MFLSLSGCAPHSNLGSLVRIHPGEALRTFIAMFPNAPRYAIKASRFCPAGYSLEAIIIGSADQFVAALISPARITYYCNIGVMTFDRPIFYRQVHKPMGAEINASFHIRTVPSLFSTWAGWQAEYVTVHGTKNLMVVDRDHPLDDNTVSRTTPAPLQPGYTETDQSDMGRWMHQSLARIKTKRFRVIRNWRTLRASPDQVTCVVVLPARSSDRPRRRRKTRRS
jgi:hypothetical protein